MFGYSGPGILRIPVLTAVLIASAWLGGCTKPESPVSTWPPAPPCPVISAAWQASAVRAKSGGFEAVLVGSVETAGPNWTLSIAPSPLKPNEALTAPVELLAAPSEAGHESRQTVRATWTSRSPIARLRILCRGTELAVVEVKFAR